MVWPHECNCVLNVCFMNPVCISCYLNPFKIYAVTIKKKNNVVSLSLARGAATILTTGKKGWLDDLIAFFAMGDHVTTVILTKSRSGNLGTTFTKTTLCLVLPSTYAFVSKHLLLNFLHVVCLHSDAAFGRAHKNINFQLFFNICVCACI